ncbi:hypothetical protein [Nocardia testacea]|uniref:hypothetical protein n=1 Tax=Nocardia testacea TaxID=248551 RepID=UPI0033DDBF29
MLTGVLIASVTRPFCGDCDRVRLTADGMLRNCIFANDEPTSDHCYASTTVAVNSPTTPSPNPGARSLRNKTAGHGIDHVCFAQPDRPMSAISG